MESIHLVKYLIQRGLDGKNRSQGCKLFGPNSQGPSAMASFLLARPELATSFVAFHLACPQLPACLQ